MPTLYLIDGNSHFYRAFYAIKGLTNSKGFPTNAIYGFINMLLKILREKKPDYISVVFDTPAPTVRHKMYVEYKAHRPKMPEELQVQIPYIKGIISAFNIPMLQMEGYEADDIIATIAKRAEAENEEIDVYIVTSDKDINQILSRRIKTYDTMKDKITEEKDVIERFKVEPERLPEIMALTGDKADNIPGVPGIGEKTAVGLIKEFGTLDGLMQNYSKIKRTELRELISKHMEDIKLSRTLAKIDSDVPVSVSMPELKLKEPDWTRLLRFFKDFEFGSLLKLIPAGEAFTETDVTVLKEEDLAKFINTIKQQPEIILDTETTSISPVQAELVGMSFSINTDTAYYLPLAHSYLGTPRQMPKMKTLAELRMILENPEIKKTGHNIKYDLIVLRNEKIDLKGLAFDTMLASYLLNPNKTNHDIEDLTMSYLGYKKLSYNDITEKGKKNFREVSVEDAARYSGGGAAATLRLKNLLAPEIEKEGLSELFYGVEMPLIEVLADMETAGIKIDAALMNDFSKELERDIAGIEKRIFFLAGGEFNINSPKQLQEILFEKLGLRTIKKTKTGFSTDVDVLEELALEHELPQEILEHRSLSKLKGTYVDALPVIVNPATGRVHTTFNQTITATGRLSSSNPNLQNIPVRGEWGRRIRAAFIAEGGKQLLSSDYSQIELRILAHLSRDEGMMEVFKNDGDIHMRTACELFGIAPEGVTPEIRRRAKVVNFGIVYGMSPFGLSRELGIRPDEAKVYIDTYFTRHGGVKKYLEAKITEAEETGSVKTIFKRKRQIPEIRSANKNTRQLGERFAINTPVQGSAADIIKLSMINIWKRLKKEGLKTKMLLQVHDELLFEVPAEEKERVQALVKEEMENAVRLDVPVKVDIGIGKNWAEAH
ncbi:MAG: DNA polymerase I [Nitrospirae bacterium]|nr:DNA polymerase I [Nitrospirota bacterium]